MDKLACVQKKGGIRKGKPRRTPVKIVYISNPLKVKASPSEFMSLVQELTGQDSDVAGVTKISQINGRDALWSVPHRGTAVDKKLVPSIDSDHRESPSSPYSSFEFFDDVFTPQMPENFTGYLPSGPFGLLNEAQVDHLLRNLDAV